MVAPNLTFETRRVPSYLKALIDNRARADGHVQRLSAVLGEIQDELHRALEQRNSCDLLIEAFNASLDPHSISPKYGWLGRHGKRGDFMSAMRAFLHRAGPMGATTSQIGDFLIATFNFQFVTKSHRWRWQSGSVRRRLSQLRDRGEVEAMPSSGPHGQSGRWRLAQAPTLTLNSLQACAGALGVEVEVNQQDDP